MGVRNALDAAIAGGADERAPVVIGEHYRYGVAKGASEHTVLAAHAAGEIA